VKQTLEDDDNPDGQDADAQAEPYQEVLRIMRLYRVQKKVTELSLLERLDLVDSLSEGNEHQLAEMLLTLKIDPAEAYKVIEDHLMDKLKGPKG
jgi:hypothetical protein